MNKNVHHITQRYLGIFFGRLFFISMLGVAILGVAMLSIAEASTYKPMIFYPPQGRFDKSFGASAYRGATMFKKNFTQLQHVYHTSYKLDNKFLLGYTTPLDSASFAKMLIHAAKAGYNPIIVIGWQFLLVAPMVVKQFPQTTFVLIDGSISGHKNLVSIQFEEEQGAYLVGMLAASKSKTKKVGIVAGMKIPPVERFVCGYTQGVKGYNKHHKKDHVTLIQPLYVGNTQAAFRNIGKAKTLTVNLYNAGADVVFGVAGLATTGVLQAAGSKSTSVKPVYAIGVDSNQDNIAPGHVLTSIIKSVNIAVYEALVLSMNGHLSNYAGKTINIGLKGWPDGAKRQSKVEKTYITQPGFKLTTDKYNKHIYTAKDRRMVNTITKDIVRNHIKVSDCSHSG